MMKFFRKYNKQLLAVFMSLLMIVFVGGTALDALLRPDMSGLVIAKSNLGSITAGDQDVARSHGELLAAIGVDWRQPMFVGTPPLEVVDFLLLGREARKLGEVPTPAAARPNVAPEDLIRLGRRLNVRRVDILTAMAEMQAIQRVAQTIASASVPSVARVRTKTRDALEKVRINAAVLPAEAFLDETLQYSESQLQEQFEKYKDRERGEGLEFGYYQLPAVRVEFVEIDRNKVAETIGIANLETKARSYYEENKSKDVRFRRPLEAEQVEGPAQDPLLSFEEAREICETEVRTAAANDMVEQIADWLIQSSGEPWVSISRDEDGFRDAPEQVKSSSYYDALLDRMPKRLAFPEAVSTWTSSWVTEANASEIGRLGKTTYNASVGASLSFPQLVFRVEPFVGSVPEGESPAEYFAMYETVPYPMTARLSGNKLVFRATMYREGRPAESLDEVRSEVIADLQLQSGFEAARAMAYTLAAREDGPTLQEAFDANELLSELRAEAKGQDVGYYEPEPFSRIQTYQVGSNLEDIGTYVGAGIGILPRESVERVFQMPEYLEDTAVLELENRPAAIAVEFVELIPAPYEEFETVRQDVKQRLSDAGYRQALRDWLDPENIRARTGFELVE